MISQDNTKQIKILLEKWESLLTKTFQKSCENAKNNCGGLNNRIQDPKGKCVIFDRQGYVDQTKIQEELSELLPKYKDIVKSVPDINDYRYNIKDYLELYFSHYKLVICKIREFALNEKLE